MGASSIEWTDETSGCVQNFQCAEAHEGLFSELLQPSNVHPCNPRQGITVPLPAVARLAGGHEVPRTSLTTATERYDVVKRQCHIVAVSAPSGKSLISPPSRHAPEPRTVPLPRVGCVAVPFVRTQMGAAPASPHVSDGQPPATDPAPRQPNCPHARPLRLCGCVSALTMESAGRIQAITSTGVNSEGRSLPPVLALATPLQPQRSSASVFLDAQPTASRRRPLRSKCRSHRPHCVRRVGQ